jgi:pyruvate/2-oxoglutarate/acetoin dehydrogenase E1 component
MGGGEHGFRGRFAQWREGSRRWQGVFRATEDMVSHFLGDRVLDLHGHGEAVAARAC